MPNYLSPTVLTSLAIGIPALYISYTATRLYRPSPTLGLSPITSSTTIPSSFATSTTVTKLINPEEFRSWDDSRSVTLKLSGKAKEWSDEQILARFTRGFFGGWVFGPERAVLRMAGVAWGVGLVSFPLQRTVNGGSSIYNEVWKASEIEGEKLPQVDSVLFGAFQVVDKQLAKEQGGNSHIDLAYGSSQRTFAGVHRFSVERLSGREGNVECGGEKVRLSMSCVTCNPREDKRVAPEWAGTFHRTYAMLLFREGVAEVVR